MLVEDHVSQGRTIFVSSHHLGEVEQICDWVGIMEGRRLLLESRLEEIRQKFRLVIASGESLPVASSPDVVSTTTDGRLQRYGTPGLAGDQQSALRRRVSVGIVMARRFPGRGVSAGSQYLLKRAEV